MWCESALLRRTPLLGQWPGEVVAAEGDLVKAAEVGAKGRQRAAEVVVREDERGQAAEARPRGRQAACEIVVVEVDAVERRSERRALDAQPITRVTCPSLIYFCIIDKTKIKAKR